MPNPFQYWRRHLAGYALGALLASAVGALLFLPLGDGLERLSYDLPFLCQSGGSAGVVMIYINPEVKRNLGEPEDIPLDRSYYTRLVDRLQTNGASLVFFDLLSFDTPHPNPQVDEEFIRSIRAQAKTVFIASLRRDDQSSEKSSLAVDVVVPVIPAISAAAGWGLANVDDAPDNLVRRIYPGTQAVPSAPWVAAQLLEAPVTRNETNRFAERWLNYYGPAGRFHSINFDQALDLRGLQSELFRGKIVFVCAGSSTGVAGTGQDTFRNPFSLVNGPRSFGGEIQALTVLNLLRGDWLEKVDRRWQLTFFLAWGLVGVFTLSGSRPWNAALIALAAFTVVLVIGILLPIQRHLWWDWLVPEIQLGVAFVWSVGFQYFVADRNRRRLRQAFGNYLSPYMADRIANSNFNLSLGGEEVEATVMFTDLENFTKMCETLTPREVSKILTTYFNLTTRAILEQDGTIIKYIGDAVMAVWGAPLPNPRHAEQAVIAAWGMHLAGLQEIEGRRLRTRIGVNSGRVLAGNLGSDFRFDYTLIGDTTNFASRLEGLNKYLGTHILISEQTRGQLSSAVKVRFLGRFVVAGKKTPIGIFEVIGLSVAFAEDPPWLPAFESALKYFIAGDLDEAAKIFEQTIAARNGKDGPSEFYLKEIAKAKLDPQPPSSWSGAVFFDSK